MAQSIKQRPASESSMVRAIKRGVAAIPHTRIKKLWSNANSRDIDLLVITFGLACIYEIKVPGEQPEPWQVGRIKFWQDSLADVGWFDSVPACVNHIKKIAHKGAVIQYLKGVIDKAMLDRVRELQDAK